METDLKTVFFNAKFQRDNVEYQIMSSCRGEKDEILICNRI